MIQKIIALFLLLLAGQGLWSLDPSKTINQYVEEEWTTTVGLPDDSVVAIGQSSDGYLWVATRKKLCRFDGLKFTIHNPFAAGQTGYEEITALIIQGDDSIWLGSRGRGLLKYKDKFKIFEFITQKDGLASNFINYLYIDLKDNLWIGTDDAYLDSMIGKEIVHYQKKDGLMEPFIFSVFGDSRGNTWIGTRGGGLYRLLNGKFLKTPVKDFDVYDATAIQEDSAGDLWIGTNRGLVRYRNDNAELFDSSRGLSGYTIYKILEDSDGNLWIGTGNGLFRIRRGRNGISGAETERTMTGSVVKAIFEDRDKSIWIGTDGRGLTRLRDGKIITFSTESGLPHEYVVFMDEDKQKNLRVGTMEGLVRFDKGVLSRETMNIEFSDAVVGPICEDIEGNTWFGTYGSGLFQLKNGQTKNYTIRDGLLSDSIFSLYCDSSGILWIGSGSGLNSLENGRFLSHRDNAGILKNEIYCIYEDKKGKLWIGTNKGVARGRNKTFSTFGDGKLPDNLMVSYVYEDNDNIVWIASKGNGLIRVQDDTDIYIFTIQNGLHSNIIYQVFEDASGYLWMSSDKGIFKIIKKDLNDLARGTSGTGTEKVEYIYYGEGDGMKTRECSRWGQHSSIQTADGKLYFGTPKGISIINPQEIKINKIAPSALIDRIVIDDKDVEYREGGVRFKSLDFIQFHFSAATLISPLRVTFKYKLEPIDNDWKTVKASQIKMAHYSDLSPGEYTFHVMAANSDGIWSEKDAAFSFTYSPGFSNSAIFKILVALVVVLLGVVAFLGYGRYRKYKKAKNKYKDSVLDAAIVEQCMKKLMYVMDIEKVYTNDKLSLQLLSKKISVTPHILSQVINEQMNKNFSDFVNGYRIEESRKRLQEADDDTSILHICYEVGFNSKSAFYRAFKKFSNMTPSQYQKTLKKEEKK